MSLNLPAHFARQGDSHLKHLKLKGLQPRTIEAAAGQTRPAIPCACIGKPMQIIPRKYNRACSTTGSDHGSRRDHDPALIV